MSDTEILEILIHLPEGDRLNALGMATELEGDLTHRLIQGIREVRPDALTW